MRWKSFDLDGTKFGNGNDILQIAIQALKKMFQSCTMSNAALMLYSNSANQYL